MNILVGILDLIIIIGPLLFMFGCMAYNFYVDCQQERHIMVERELTRALADEAWAIRKAAEDD